MQSNSEQVLFGLRFSSLTMLKQNSVGLRMGQVSKVVEVEGLEIYCSICKDTAKDLSLSNTGGSESWFNSHSVGSILKGLGGPCFFSQFSRSLILFLNLSLN
ncbi:hypothetical protein ES332_A04G122300v1 [Gossypium tomentosum]|uniref:Uncharacterized protein n=1 Tax=Gossypium tomentosum TaxID=34277 RepID=A0A5D2QXA6_GOSTO|nr:hypothetical protein ES332_A04G122300v1 [Gossypium tomentosum]